MFWESRKNLPYCQTMEHNFSKVFERSEFSDVAKNTFEDLLSDGNFTDVTLVTEDNKQIKVHKVILSACSPFFKHVLSTNVHPHPLMYLKGVDSQSLTCLLQYMYLGRVKVQVDSLQAFIRAAQDLKVFGLDNIENFNPTAKRQREEYMGDGLDTDMTQINDQDFKTKPCVQEDEDDDIQIVSPLKENNAKIQNLYCDYCNFETRERGIFEDHKNSHKITIQSKKSKQIAVHDFPCKECNFSTNSTEELKCHILNIHNGLPCNNCKKRFGDLNSLRTHILNDADCKANCLK